MIECNAEINFGMPALKGRRLTVYDIVTMLYYDESILAALNGYSISMEDAKDAVDYCRHLKCKHDEKLIQFCDGCILRTLAEGWEFKKEDYMETVIDGQKIVISNDKRIFFIGSLDELENSEFGKVTWLMAEEMEKKLANYSEK